MAEPLNQTLSETESKYYDIIVSHAIKIAQEQNLSFYNNWNGNFVTTEQYENRYKTIDSHEELKEFIGNKKYNIAAPKEFANKLMLDCIQNEDEGFRKFFFDQSRLVYFYNKNLNQVLEENKHQPELVFDLIAHMKYPMGSIERDKVEKTIELLMTDYPQPEGRQALILYMLKQHESDNIRTYNGTTNVYQSEILQYLKKHVPNHLEEFSFFDFVKIYVDAQKSPQLFSDSPIEKTLMLNFSANNLTNYLGLPGFFITHTEDWIVQIKKALESQKEQWGVHSVDIYDEPNKSKGRIYVNLKEGSALTQKMLGESFNGLVNTIKDQGHTDFGLVCEEIAQYFKSAWLEHKISQGIGIEIGISHHDEDDSPKMKI
jgi:hypothetical protein